MSEKGVVNSSAKFLPPNTLTILKTVHVSRQFKRYMSPANLSRTCNMTLAWHGESSRASVYRG